MKKKINIQIELQTTENFYKLMLYRFNEELYKNKEQFINFFLLKLNIDEFSKFQTNDVVTSYIINIFLNCIEDYDQSMIEVFINYLLQDNIKYHTKNQIFENFLKNYKE